MTGKHPRLFYFLLTMNKRKKANKAYHVKMTQKLAGILAGFSDGYGVGKSNTGMMQGGDKINPRYK
tara:strand:- start:140 stop:337 length:198 start_codon:yes stop_codon:yes gene_type:complete